MATEFLQIFNDNEYLLTSQLDSIKAQTSKLKVDVQLVRDPDGAADLFFSTTLYAFNNIVELYEVGSLIEERFRSQNRTLDKISMRIDDANLDFVAIYCSHQLNYNFNYKNCFWSSAASAVVHPGSVISLSHFNSDAQSYNVKVIGLNSFGEISMVEKTFPKSSDSDSLELAVDDIVNFALNNSAVDPELNIVKVSYFAVAYGKLQKIFYLLDDTDFLTFRFKNLFNCTEYVDVTGKVNRKSVFDRDIAVCGGKARQYNRVTNLTYEVETGPLTPDQAITLEDLFASYNVQLVSSPDDYDILITDHSCERDNDDENLVSMKFSFRFAGNRNILLPDDLLALNPNRNNIFSKEFTAEFQ